MIRRGFIVFIVDGVTKDCLCQIIVETGALVFAAGPDVISAFEKKLDWPYVISATSGNTLPVFSEGCVELLLSS